MDSETEPGVMVAPNTLLNTTSMRQINENSRGKW
jgi:hypothetical protein